MTSLDCSPDVILLFVLMKYAKMSYFVPLGFIAVVGIQVENLEVIRMKNTEVFQKGVW